MNKTQIPRILIVEDSTTQQVLMRVLCENFGFAASIVGSGEEAIAAVKIGPTSYDAILMDWKLIGMDGAECTKLIRELEAPTNRRTPIIAVTAHAMKGDREACLAAGMDDYLSKPFRADELQNLVLRWTNSGAHSGTEVTPGFKPDDGDSQPL